MTRLPVAAIAFALSLPVATASSQSTLAEALRSADRAGWGNRMAAGQAGAQRAQAIAPLRGILPSLRAEAGYVRTTDPIGAFGTILRQGAVTPAAFDPARLNRPPTASNYTGGLVVEQPLLNADAWAGRAAASRAADAAEGSERWTRLRTRVDVVQAWYGAALAAQKVRTLDVAATAAHAHVRQAESLVKGGLATKSDALLAAVRAGEVDAQLAEARAAAGIAHRQLAMTLGRPSPEGLSPPADLPDASRIRVIVEGDTLPLAARTRADVQAADAGLAAARADVKRARATLLPRLNAFARYDWNSPVRSYDGPRNWTAGIMTSWSPFTGASELADLRGAASRADAARAGAEAAHATAALEVEQSRATLAAALQRLDIAERAVSQGAEARRIVERKYEGGLATITDLLDAQGVETQTALGFAAARYAAIVAAAQRQLALGGDPAALAALERAP
ncbi:MAG: TolC family protein [Gemmatimonadaceae bacterium]